MLLKVTFIAHYLLYKIYHAVYKELEIIKTLLISIKQVIFVINPSKSLS